MKAKLIKLQFILLCLLGLYPLLKFNYSSQILISFSTISVFIGIKYKTFNFDKKNWRSFLFLCAYLFLLFISVAYSTNTDNALKRSVQFLPLLIAPFFVSFYQFQFPKNFKKTTISVFIAANILFTIIISAIFLFNIHKTNLGLLHFLLDYDKFQLIVDKSIDNDLIFIHKAYFSMGFVICAIYCLREAIGFYKTNRTSFRIYSIIFMYFFLWLFYGFSFPNIIALAIGVTVLLYFNLNRKNFIKTLAIFTLVCVSLVVFKLNDVDVQRGFNFVKSTVDEQEYEVNDARKEIYASHLNILESASITELAFGFGVGDPEDLLNEDYERRFLERKIKNLLFFNEEFDHPYWFKNSTKVGNNVIQSSEGKLKNAEILLEESNDSIASHSISRDIDITQHGTYTLSVFAKKGHSNSVILRLGDIKQRATFDLEKGTIIKTLNVDDAKIEKVSDDWYRCSIEVNINSNPLALIGMSNENADYHYKSNGSGFYIWGAQLEQGHLTTYKKNGSELLNKAIEKRFNSHNNYLFMILSAGFVGLIAFLAFLIHLFRNAITEKSLLRITFCTLLVLNFLTENIFSRQWGLLFFAFMLLVLFSKNKEQIIE